MSDNPHAIAAKVLALAQASGDPKRILAAETYKMNVETEFQGEPTGRENAALEREQRDLYLRAIGEVE